MEDFNLYDDKRVPIPVIPGFPPDYVSYALPGALQCHAYHGRLPMLFQAVRCGRYEIAISDYLINTGRKVMCKANVACLELHFILKGKVLFNLKDLGWEELDELHHNMIALSDVKNEVYFKIIPVSTFDVHFLMEDFKLLAKKYPQLQPLLKALQTKGYASLFALPEKTTPGMLHLIVKIKEAIKDGKTNDITTIEMIENLVVLVLENEPVKTKYKYNYTNIEKIHNAHYHIGQYVEEKDILSGKMKKSGMKPDKFREGFRLLYGLLPSQYLLERRLQKADWLIKEKRVCKLDDIAELCGFKSIEQLSKDYQHKFGTKISDVIAASKNSK